MTKKLKKRLMTIVVGAIMFIVSIVLSHLLPIIEEFYIDLAMFLTASINAATRLWSGRLVVLYI